MTYKEVRLEMSDKRKAIAAAITAAVSFAFVHFGINDVEGELQGAIVTILTTVAVYFIPNS